MFSFSRVGVRSDDLISSRLFDEKSFYKQFVHDLARCSTEAVIESPFITGDKVTSLLPIFLKMRSRGVRIVINTRHPSEHDQPFDIFAARAIDKLQSAGVEVLYTGKHHRKLAIFDRNILWEGSLNILSQNDSCEIMRRISSTTLAEQMLYFTKLGKHLK